MSVIYMSGEGWRLFQQWLVEHGHRRATSTLYWQFISESRGKP